MTEEDCGYCEDPIHEDDMSIRIRETQWVPLETNSAVYHAGCFMDIVNSEERPVKRTDIMEGNLSRQEGELDE